MNVQDAASTLLNYLKSNGSSLSGSLASDTSESSLELTLGEEEDAINSVTNLSNISSGSFQINGVSIKINVDTDSLNNIIDRVNNAETGAQLSYNYSDQTITISSLYRNQILLQNGSSNFFSGLNLHEGYISGDVSNNEESIVISPETQLHFNRFASRFNRLMNSDFMLAEEEGFRDALIKAAKNSVRDFIDKNFSSGEIRLESNVRMTINSDAANFLSSSISFEDADTPLDFFNLLTSSKGIISPFTSLTNNNQLKESLSQSSKNGLIISSQL